MLTELRVQNLGVIDDLALLLGPGMTALSGETGAGKTLVVDAIELLLGGRADSALVRFGSEEALVEGRFADSEAGHEVIIARALPSKGRSRCYLDGRMSNLEAIASAGQALVDLHGQHAHQSLLSSTAQAQAFDAACGIDTSRLQQARRLLRAAQAELLSLGGDERQRLREADLVRYQLEELEAAALFDPDEDIELAGEIEKLENAESHREAASSLHDSLISDGGVIDRIGVALSASASSEVLAELRARLRGAAAELSDIATQSRELSEQLQDDPSRLESCRTRRALLRDLRRKYGDELAEVIATREKLRTRSLELDSWAERAAAAEDKVISARKHLEEMESEVGSARRKASPGFAEAVQEQIRVLAMPSARFEVQLSEDAAASEVTWLLGANPGEPALALSKVASGGELARAMLAVRLVLTDADVRPQSSFDGEVPDQRFGDGNGFFGRRTLVFDEVDAGIGGEAATAVGMALQRLARHYQVIVVTHLAQVAACADVQMAVSKHERDGRTVSEVRTLDHDGRVIELSRMMSGRPDSISARQHATELLSAASHRGVV